ncbi:MAG: regulatory protein RecX [Candidatus Binatia bacterium]
MRLLAGRDRSAHEIRGRLTAVGISPAAIAETVRRLQDRGYLDDRRFALGAAERALRRGYGSEFLRATLQQQGVADAAIEAALHAAYSDEIAVARLVLGRRFGSLPRTAAEQGRAARFLARRGFPEAVVFAILGEAC